MGQKIGPICAVWASDMSIRIRDVPYAYGPIYTYAWGKTSQFSVSKFTVQSSLPLSRTAHPLALSSELSSPNSPEMLQNSGY